MRESSCLLCKKRDAELLSQYVDDPYHRHLEHLRDIPVTYVICRSCGLVYTDPMLDERELHTLYSDKLRPTRPDPAYLKANRKVYEQRYRWIARELGLPRSGEPPPTVLDVGCAAGIALSVFRERGWIACGIEPAETFAAYARESLGLDVQTGFYGPGAFEGRTFDLIVFSQVLEHVPDPDALLAQARLNLKEDGSVFVGVPTLMRPLQPVHPMTLQAVHLWIFSLPTLRLLLARHGFDIFARSYDHKGLMVLARKRSEPMSSPDLVGDDPNRVRHYFAQFVSTDSRYARNLAALQSRGRHCARPALFDVDLSEIVVEPSPDGYLNLGARTDGGTRWLYQSDPRQSAAQIAARCEFGEDGVVCVLGLGLGYLPLALLEKLKRGHVLVICEADPRVFRAAMFHQDLTRLLSDERVFFVIGDQRPTIDDVMALVSRELFTGKKMHTVRCRASVQWNPAYYEKTERRMKERLKVLEINRNTIGNLGLRMVNNILDNAHLTMQMPGVSRFAGLFKGCPAIVVSAGPSLEKNFRLLKQAKGRAVIIACDTVLRLLVPNGIVPDVTITADPHEATYRKFRDLPMDPEAILICHPANYPDIFRTFAGRRFTTETGLALYRFLSRFWPSKGRVDERSQSSAHQAFNFASLIGADPIIFVGQDLCYYEKRKHAGNLTKGSPFERRDADRERETAVDILGQKVETTTLFLSFKIVLEDLIRESQARVINATEGGLGLKGTEVMTLRDAIAQYCPPEPIGIAERFRSVPDDEPGRIDRAGLKAAVWRLHTQAKETQAIVQKMLKYVRRASRLIKRGKEASQRAQYLSELAERQSQMMAGREQLMSMLVEAAYLLELYMSREATKAIDEIQDPLERFRKQIERASFYYNTLKDVLKPFVSGTETLIKRLDELDRLDQMPARSVLDRLKIARAYKELMDYPRATQIYQEVLRDQPNNLEALFHLGELYYLCHRPQEAIPLLKQVAVRSPRFRNVEELITRCREKTEVWAAKVAEAREVGGEERDHVALLLYEANFYWLAGDKARAKEKFAEARAACPTRPDLYLAAARVYEEGGEPEAALGVLEEALVAFPQKAWPLKELGLFSVRQGALTQAERFLRAAVCQDPSMAEAAGEALFEAGRYLAAGELFEEALRLDPARSGLVLKAAIAYQKASAQVGAIRDG